MNESTKNSDSPRSGKTIVIFTEAALMMADNEAQDQEDHDKLVDDNVEPGSLTNTHLGRPLCNENE